MSPRTIRQLVWIVFVSGIAGMIVGSIRDSNGVAITFGLVTAVAALGLILVTSVAPPGSLARARRPGEADDAPAHGPVDPALARDVEDRVVRLVDAGADEEEVRRLVRRAVDLGRSTPARDRASTQRARTDRAERADETGASAP